MVTKPVVACSSLVFPFAACSDEAVFKSNAAASFFFYSSAAAFFFSSSAAFCLASASAAECIMCGSKKRVIIATISANKLQYWWCVGYKTAAASAAALFEASSSAAFCLASASAVECIICGWKKKRVIIATISANKLQCWWCVGYKPAAALFEASSSAAFCLASASAAECIICGSKKIVIIATISVNKLQCWWCVSYEPAAASAAALFEASSSAAFCLASASAAECVICRSKKKL
jgi:hypothetical protein